MVEEALVFFSFIPKNDGKDAFAARRLQKISLPIHTSHSFMLIYPFFLARTEDIAATFLLSLRNEQFLDDSKQMNKNRVTPSSIPLLHLSVTLQFEVNED